MNNNRSPILQVIKSEYPPVFREKMGNKELVKRKTGFVIYFLGIQYFFQDELRVLKSADTVLISILKMTVQVPSVREILCFCRYFGILYNFTGPFLRVCQVIANKKQPQTLSPTSSTQCTKLQSKCMAQITVLELSLSP